MARYRLGSICQIISGSTPKTGVQEYWNGDKKWITPAELSESDYIIYDTERKLTEAGVRSAGLTPLPKGTVILSSRAPIGKVAIAGCEMYCNQGFKNFVCSNIINNKYLYWYLRSKTDFLNSLGRGATFKEISKSTVADIELDIPELSEQSKRVAHLEKLQSIIASRRIQLAKLDELVKCRFVELFGITNEYARFPVLRLHELCKNADDIKCGPFGTQLNKEEYQTAGVPIWEIPQINSNFAIPPVHFISNEKAHLLRFYDAVSGDIIMSRKGKVGMCTIFPNNVAPGVIHSDVLRIRLNEEKASNIFICALFRYSWDVENQLARISMGAIMPGVNVTKLKQLQVIVPPLNLQQTFAVFVRRIDKLRIVIRQSLDEAQKLFDSLMQEYFD
ncbi:MAG: hypothetical protein E7030_03180 [Akkermansiaceae bacterium]|nr:hypothetical protein [Akkermansiaceae bacterium]